MKRSSFSEISQVAPVPGSSPIVVPKQGFSKRLVLGITATITAAVLGVANALGLVGLTRNTPKDFYTSSRYTSPEVDPKDPSDAVFGLGDSLMSAASEKNNYRGSIFCHRSADSPAVIVADRLNWQVGLEACAGAKTEALVRDQLPHLTDKARLILVSTGSNDASLVSVLQRCIPKQLRKPCAGEVEPQLQEGIPYAAREIYLALVKIKAAAVPDAQIVYILPTKVISPVRYQFCTPVHAADASMLTEYSDEAIEAFEKAARQAGAAVFDPNQIVKDSDYWHYCTKTSPILEVTPTKVLRGTATTPFLHPTSDFLNTMGKEIFNAYVAGKFEQQMRAAEAANGLGTPSMRCPQLLAQNPSGAGLESLC